MKYAVYASAEQSIASFIPYTRFVDPATLRTKDGHLLQTIKLDGIAHETCDSEELEHHKTMRANLLHNLSDSRYVIYHHMIRRNANHTINSFYENDFCRSLDQSYHASLSKKHMFQNEYYITLIRRPTPGVYGIAEALKRIISRKVDQALYEDTLQDDLKALTSEMQSLIEGLEAYQPQLLTLEETNQDTFCPLLSFLGYLINLDHKPIALPQCAIDQALPLKRISFGRETFEVRGAESHDTKLGAMISVKSYSTHSMTGMFDALLNLPHEFTLTQSYACIDTQDALNFIRACQRKMIAGEHGAHALEEQLDTAIDEVASGLTSFGDHHLSLCAIGHNERDLDNAVTHALGVFKPLGVQAVREDLNMEPLFWAQLPANTSFIARKSMISHQNFSAYAGLHNVASGQKSNNYWGDAVTCFETTSGTPYWFNFHEPSRDVGNFTLFGPTGYGKTALLCFLHAQAQKFSPKSFFFDKDRGAEIYLRAIGGQYTIIRSGKPTGLNPLQLPDTQDNRAFLREWLQLLLITSGKADLTIQQRHIIADAIDANYDAPLQHRRLANISELLGGFETNNDTPLQDRLAMWHSMGERAWLFDNETDSLELGAQTIGFDMTSILDDPTSRTPWLFYIFHRIQSTLVTKQKTIIMLDEGWKLLDDPIFSRTLKDWLKTIRKLGGLVGFATQSTDDACHSAIASTLLEQCPTQIFLPNPKAKEADYCGHFQLTANELHEIRNFSAQSHCFLIKQGKKSVIAKLDLSNMKDVIAILSGRTETLRILDTLRQSFPTPEEWLPHYTEKVCTS